MLNTMCQRSLKLMTSLAFGAVAAIGLGGCGSAAPSATPSSPMSTGASTSGSPSPTSAPTTPYQRATPAPTSVTGAKDVHVTAQVRSDLVAAGAAARGLTASAFTGLRPGETYYAYDATTKTYWAGGALVPSSSSYRAQVSSQDDGGYTLFHRSATGSWVAVDGGMAGPNSGTGAGPCRVVPPTDVLAIWGWPANSCHPNGV